MSGCRLGGVYETQPSVGGVKNLIGVGFRFATPTLLFVDCAIVYG